MKGVNKILVINRWFLMQKVSLYFNTKMLGKRVSILYNWSVSITTKANLRRISQICSPSKSERYTSYAAQEKKSD